MDIVARSPDAGCIDAGPVLPQNVLDVGRDREAGTMNNPVVGTNPGAGDCEPDSRPESRHDPEVFLVLEVRQGRTLAVMGLEGRNVLMRKGMVGDASGCNEATIRPGSWQRVWSI